MPDAEHVVDNFEALVLRRVVNGSDITNLSELCSGVIFEEGEHRDDTRWCDADAQLVLPDGKSAVLLLKRFSNDILAHALLDIFWQTGHQILPISMESLSLLFVSVGWIDDWSFELARRRVSRCKLHSSLGR